MGLWAVGGERLAAGALLLKFVGEIRGIRSRTCSSRACGWGGGWGGLEIWGEFGMLGRCWPECNRIF